MALQEIKAEVEQIHLNIFDRDFKELHVNSSLKKGQSGVALFSDIKPSYIDTSKKR